MAAVLSSRDFSQQDQREAGSACGGWVESSFDLHRGMEVTEDVGFDEFERLRALDLTPPSHVNPWTEPSRRRR